MTQDSVYKATPSEQYAVKLGKQHGTEEAHRVKHLLGPMNQTERVFYFSSWWSIVIVHMKAAVGPEAARAITDTMKLLADGAAEGWKLVPREPTRAMLDAWTDASRGSYTHRSSKIWPGLHYSDSEARLLLSYQAMLTAAPQPSAAPQVPVNSASTGNTEPPAGRAPVGEVGNTTPAAAAPQRFETWWEDEGFRFADKESARAIWEAAVTPGT